VRSLASQWNCTPGTVHRAYQHLQEQGMVTSRRGQGTQVTHRPETTPAQTSPFAWAHLIHQLENVYLEAMRAGFPPADLDTALAVVKGRYAALQKTPPHTPAFPTSAARPDLHFAGSHDLLLDWLLHSLENRPEQWTIQADYIGSLSGLYALLRGEADLTGVHLWDEASGEYNLPFIERLLPDLPVLIVTLAHRSLGLILAPGNPLKLQSISNLTRPGVRFVNRQPGAGVRVWFDRQLHLLGISPTDIHGYQSELLNHYTVAAAVAHSQADAGLGIVSAAATFGLDFIPLTLERYDLVIPAQHSQRPQVQALLAGLHSKDFRQTAGQLGGYRLQETGQTRPPS
jgi:molybdate-binding protein